MVDKARYTTWQPGDIAVRKEIGAGGDPPTMYHLQGAQWRALQNPNTADYDRVEITGQLPPGAPAFQVGERLVVSLFHHIGGATVDDVSQSDDTVQLTASERGSTMTLDLLLGRLP
jgi:hypothetical protein